LAASRRDPDPSEERWQTIGLIGYVVVFVVHTWPESDPATGEGSGPHHQRPQGDLARKEGL